VSIILSNSRPEQVTKIHNVGKTLTLGWDYGRKFRLTMEKYDTCTCIMNIIGKFSFTTDYQQTLLS